MFFLHESAYKNVILQQVFLIHEKATLILEAGFLIVNLDAYAYRQALDFLLI